jgi:hypothetical protein
MAAMNSTEADKPDKRDNLDKPAKREITYQVGWSRGKINPSASPSSNRIVRAERFMERIVWRRLPGAAGRGVAVLLWAAPIVSFAITYALVFALMQSASR